MPLIPRGLLVLRSLHFADWVRGIAGSFLVGFLLGVGTWLWHRSGSESLGWGVAGFVCGGVLWIAYQARWGLVRPYPPPFRWRRHLPWGILWNFEGFLVANRDEGVVHIRCVQVRGFNRSRRFVHLQSAHIVSAVTTNSTQMLVQTSSGYVLPSNTTVRIPPKAEFKILALIDNAASGSPQDGMREEEFRREYSGFHFMAVYDHTLFCKAFRAVHIYAELEQLKATRAHL
jgi:hypothetical protein